MFISLIEMYRLPHKSLSIMGSPPRKSPWADNLPAKICPAQAAAGRGGFFAGKLSAGGDPIMGHRLIDNQLPEPQNRDL